jgi:hypothetical protein
VPNHGMPADTLMPVVISYVVIAAGFACAVLAFIIVLAACVRDWHGGP